MAKKKTRGEKAGEGMADTIIEWLHLMYQYDTQIRVLTALLDKLQKHLKSLKFWRAAHRGPAKTKEKK